MNDKNIQSDRKYPHRSILLNGETATFQIHSYTDVYALGWYDNMLGEFSDILSALAPTDAVCLDLGANIGLTSFLMSRHADNGKILSVEGGANNYQLLLNNIQANQLNNVTAEHYVLGEHDGEIGFHENSAFGHVAEHGLKTPMISLNSLVAKHKLDRIDFIKIDIEGHEYPVLKNSLDILKKFNPLIFLEFNVWCQLALKTVDPIVFAAWLFDNFAFKTDNLRLVHDAIVLNPGFVDLLLTNDPSVAKCLDLMMEIELLKQEAAGLRAANETLSQETIGLKTERINLYNSKSWRITKPLRWLAHKIR